MIITHISSFKSAAVIKGAFDDKVKGLFDRHPKFKLEPMPLRYGCDYLVLTGGEDVDPRLYGQKPIQSTYYSPGRDSQEVKLYEFFSDVPKIGICRGAQLLNVLNGGTLWQDTDNHHTGHEIKFLNTGESFRGTSIHHQMMRPGPDAEIIGIADESSYVEDDKGTRYKEDEHFDDIEIIYYPKTKSLCWQGHPEIGTREEVDLFFKIIEQTVGI